MPDLLARACAQCDADMEGKRPHAVYCSRRCKTSASDGRRRDSGRGKGRDRSRYHREADHRREYARWQSRRLRDRVLAYYGATCVRCGSTDDLELELDHVHGNGERHRDLVGHGDAFRRWLIRGRFPSECDLDGEYALQVLCQSCHVAKTRDERKAKSERG